ncbi:MAG TPA: hypothetical protein VKF42_03320 [Chitinivibrionales bacterium]|jgi:hypothetical protein|nr:hypothetical protein [Chitinivibrionales bacterium]
MEPEIVKTDKQFRTRLFTMYLVCLAAIGLAIGFGIRPYLSYMGRVHFQELMTASEISIICLLVPLIGPSIYLIVVGRRIIRSKRMPYPGQKVIHDTKVIDGSRAIRRGRTLLWLGIVCIFFVVIGVGRSVYLIEKFRHINPFKNWKPPTRVVMIQQARVGDSIVKS